MSQEEALTIIKQACASVVGNLAVHEKIQKALEVISSELDKASQKK